MIRLSGLLLLLAGCASVPLPSEPVTSPEQSWETRQQQLGELKNWQLSGRVIISNNENDAWRLDVIWQQQQDNYEIQISGPLGMGKVRLHGSNDGVFFYDSDGRAYYAQEPEQLLFEHTGIFMPVTSLYYWVRGLPDPTIKAELKSELDNWGRLSQLRQNGWSVDLKRYVQIDALQLPDKLFIHNEENVEVRMVVDTWEIYPVDWAE
ncbi:hypothetical protein MNBD_GAMMA25-963 [hydrothermal vent metagenome]|uniref:Outer-membrane lipoprotein LolB n=1 Tax=hydrothermal vent metagenome TaxID=652676 RepID=A0A3B1BSU4_9ZZZZ